ncbi:MAG: GntR family transcriptional regulator [Hungatella sp.]|jgi:GntR family transcriptional regulator|nr:GntR family transcriptional regulator [Hungatella sp.]
MKLDVGNEIPLYQQLKEELKTAIKDGTFPYGQKIPTETELSKLFNVSRITSRLVTRREGTMPLASHACPKLNRCSIFRFTFACLTKVPFPCFFDKKSSWHSSSTARRTVISLSSEDATAMGVLTGSPAISIQRVNMADGFPIMCENNLYPYDRFSFFWRNLLTALFTSFLKINTRLRSPIPLTLTWILYEPGGDVAKLLQVSNGEPLFFLYCQIYDQNHELIHIGKQYINGDQYRFYLEDYKVL